MVLRVKIEKALPHHKLAMPVAICIIEVDEVDATIELNVEDILHVVKRVCCDVVNLLTLRKVDVIFSAEAIRIPDANRCNAILNGLDVECCASGCLDGPSNGPCIRTQTMIRKVGVTVKRDAFWIVDRLSHWNAECPEVVDDGRTDHCIRCERGKNTFIILLID